MVLLTMGSSLTQLVCKFFEYKDHISIAHPGREVWGT